MELLGISSGGLFPCDFTSDGKSCCFQNNHRGNHLTFDGQFDEYGLPINADLHDNGSVKNSLFGHRRRWNETCQIFKYVDLYKIHER